MMKTPVVLLLAFLSSALAAPAVVWKNGETGAGLRTSESLKVEDLLSDVLSVQPEPDSSLAAVVFLLARGDDGSESLSTLASSGALPNVAMKYNNADAIHHHVSGVESPASVVRDVARAAPGHNALLVSVSELNSRLTPHSEAEEIEVTQNGLMSKTRYYNHIRAKKIASASVLVVQVNPRSAAAEIDSAVIKTIDSDLVANVVLTGVRSHAEVKHERLLDSQRRLSKMPTAGKNTNKKIHGRRLEDEQEEDNNNNGDNDMSGVYYVSMTPNILAGILFTFLFIVVTWIGVSCMGMIAGQDVYVTKLPPVGREA